MCTINDSLFKTWTVFCIVSCSHGYVIMPHSSLGRRVCHCIFKMCLACFVPFNYSFGRCFYVTSYSLSVWVTWLLSSWPWHWGTVPYLTLKCTVAVPWFSDLSAGSIMVLWFIPCYSYHLPPSGSKLSLFYHVGLLVKKKKFVLLL